MARSDGAGRSTGSGERQNLPQRNPRTQPRHAAGLAHLKIPKLPLGSYSPHPGARKTVEKALVAVIQEAWIAGVSTRRVDDLVQAMGLSGISKSSVSKLSRTSMSG